ncbi:MAG: CPBP family intramembrane metalloprotease [Paludibacteraceae bacterium]|nr:CPBP family intramembrane metalloprotease [Paludibacteraceae bacterium]
MWKSYFRESGVVSKLLQLTFLFFFLSMMVVALNFVVFGVDVSNGLRFRMILERVFMFIIPPFVLAFVWYEKPFEGLFINRFPSILQSVAVILLSVFIVPFVNVISELNSQLVFPSWLSGMDAWMRQMESLAAETTLTLLNVSAPELLAMNILLVGIVPAIGEELFFRAGIQKVIMQNRNVHAAIWISAFVFSAIHMQFFGFLPRMLLGALYGYLMVWSGSLWLPVLAHFVNNTVAVVVYYLRYNGATIPDPESVGLGNQWWITLVSVIVSISLIYILYKSSIKEDAC